MQLKTTRSYLTGATLLLAAAGAQAFCVSPTGFPPNDVALEVPFASASTAPTALEVDMNGVQRGLSDELPWATHGTMLVLIDPNGNREWIASWTQNSSRRSDEWVCRMRPTATGAITGTGAVHTVIGGALPTTTVIQECKLGFTDC